MKKDKEGQRMEWRKKDKDREERSRTRKEEEEAEREKEKEEEEEETLQSAMHFPQGFWEEEKMFTPQIFNHSSLQTKF